MSLNCGIIGLASSGKTTIFNCLSKAKAQTSKYAFSSNKSNIGIIKVPDDRLILIDNLIHSAKIVHATIEIIDIPGLSKSSNTGEGIGNKFLSDIRNTDALIHVLRCFENESVPHIEGSIDPVRDKEIVDFELQIKDLESIYKKLVKLEKLTKIGDKDAKKAYEILLVYKEHLESMKPARTVPLDETSRKYASDLFLLTDKPVLYVCNVNDDAAVIENNYVKKVKEAVKAEDTEVIVIAGVLESDIAELESEDDRNMFLKEIGLEEPAINKLIRSAYKLLNLRTFFTAGPKEVKAWTIKAGMTAPEAARTIHSDIERGFIRAEVMKFNDFITLGSEQACKEAGKFYIEGKNYIVEDGDILHFRFNV